MRVLTLVLLAGFATTACDKKRGITESDNFVSGITITPNPATMTILESRQFSAAGINQVGGGAIAITPVWSVVSGGGTISSSGVFTAGMQTGSFTQTIMATSNGLTATATVIVTVGPITSITVTPTPATLAAGATQQFTAVGRDAADNVVAFTPTWSMAGAGGTINGSGVFTAGGTPGTYTGAVMASNGTVNGVATVVVTAGPLANMVITPDPATMAVGATQQYIATSTDAFGNVIANSPTWTVTNGGGTINATGLFTAGTTPGAFNNTIRAQSGGISATATAIVTAGPLATIVVTPNPVTLDMGATQQFTAVGTDANGNVVAITPTWSVASGGGTIVGNGQFTAGSTAGTFANTVRATSGGISGSA
ncbi:MAG TPA: hypothetical protein VK928_08670, partial [Longimicrobiales bacterium]|nr:hypothetical protein [Longimicrobiales bacterium]